MDKTAIRDAATLILVRRDGAQARVLMGQRGAGAAFMPGKFVFPGGAVDPADRALAGGTSLHPACAPRLATAADPGIGPALALAAVRETFEETGLALGRPGTGPAGDHGPDWSGFFALGLLPATEALRFIFRAVTPPGRPRRFDARFFLADAAAIAGDPDDFSRASDELSHLTWLELDAARALPLPFITEIVLAEVEEILATGLDDRPIPYFHHDDQRSYFAAL